MDKQTSLNEIVTRSACEVLRIFPKRACEWNEIRGFDFDKIDTFADEYLKEVVDILLKMVIDLKKNVKTIDNCNK